MGNSTGKLAEGGKLSEAEIERFQRRFQRLAKGGDTVSIKELCALPELAENPMAHRMLEVFDQDGDGHVSCQELLALVSYFPTLAEGGQQQQGGQGPAADQDRELRAKLIFKAYDKDGDGRVSCADMCAVLAGLAGPSMTEAQLAQVAAATISEYDADRDQCLSLPEFQAMLADQEVCQRLAAGV